MPILHDGFEPVTEWTSNSLNKLPSAKYIYCMASVRYIWQQNRLFVLLQIVTNVCASIVLCQAICIGRTFVLKRITVEPLFYNCGTMLCLFCDIKTKSQMIWLYCDNLHCSWYICPPFVTSFAVTRSYLHRGLMFWPNIWCPIFKMT